MTKLFALLAFFLASSPIQAKEVAGVHLSDSIVAANGDQLILNGAGIRSKFWIDIYVGSLYLKSKVKNFADVLSMSGPLRIQMDFVYSEVDKEKLIDAWNEGFEDNQTEANLKQLQDRIAEFNGFFDQNAVEGDQYTFDYTPGEGTKVSRNQQQIGIIEGADFKDALLHIWLGNSPADSDLKEAMLNQE